MNFRPIITAFIAFVFSCGIAVAQQAPVLQPRDAAMPNTIPSGTGLHIVLDEELSSATAKINDPFTAHLQEPLVVNGITIAPSGTVVKGRIKDVTNAGRRFRGVNDLTARPETLLLADGRQIDISGIMTDTYDRKSLKVNSEGAVHNGPGHYGRMAVIGAGVGTVAGAVVGGPVGAIAGGSIGAALPGARWATKDDPVVLPSGSSYWFELTRPAPLTSDRAAINSDKATENRP